MHLPPRDMGDWEREIWDEWASAWPWSPTRREQEERDKHRARRVARHHYRLWDALEKRITLAVCSELTWQTPLRDEFWVNACIPFWGGLIIRCLALDKREQYD